MNFENKPELGVGIYTTAEISQILRIKYATVHRWINKYWDGELGKEFAERYSWVTGNSRAVGFHTLVEFYVMMQFSEAGVKTKKILEAHKLLSKKYDTAFPFALKSILESIQTDGNTIYLDLNGDILSLDGTTQFNLDFIKIFFKKLEFDSGEMATRFWPMGRKNSIIIDPKRKFGHPVINGYNIYPETIFGMFKAGEPKPYIAAIYELSHKEIDDAIEFCQAA